MGAVGADAAHQGDGGDATTITSAAASWLVVTAKLHVAAHVALLQVAADERLAADLLDAVVVADDDVAGEELLGLVVQVVAGEVVQAGEHLVAVETGELAQRASLLLLWLITHGSSNALWEKPATRG